MDANSEILHQRLTKVDETMAWVDLHLTREAESLAALHLSNDVRYSPLLAEVRIARQNLGDLLEDLAKPAVKALPTA